MLTTLRATRALPHNVRDAAVKMHLAADSVNAMATQAKDLLDKHAHYLTTDVHNAAIAVRNAAHSVQAAADKHRETMELVESVLWGVVLGLAAGMALRTARKLRGHLG